MDISGSSTEAFARYNEFHVNLNLTTKVSAASVIKVKDLVSDSNGDKIMGGFIDALEMPWGKEKTIPNPIDVIDKVSENLSYYSLVQAFSGFEYYMTHLIADLAHFSSLKEEKYVHSHTDSDYDPRNPPKYAKCCFSYAEQFAKNNVLAVRINLIKDDLNIRNDSIDKLLPLFHYFRLIRNCIVHLEGFANKELIDHIDTSDFNTSYDYWNKEFGREKSPELPIIERNKKIKLSPAHAIFASAVNYKIGQILNSHASQIIGLEGFVEMASYYSLFVDDHFYRSVRTSSSPEGAVSNYLSNRYLIRDVKADKTIEWLKRLDFWKNCIRRFEILKYSK